MKILFAVYIYAGKKKDRKAFREWLSDNCISGTGVWLLFGKAGVPETVKAAEALEEALCFGWIDGQMKSMDEKTYKKYFSMRRQDSRWSEKNKTLVERLEKQGILTDNGRRKIEEAEKNGQWDVPKVSAIAQGQLSARTDLLQEYEPECTNFRKWPHRCKKHMRGHTLMQKQMQAVGYSLLRRRTGIAGKEMDWHKLTASNRNSCYQI